MFLQQRSCAECDLLALVASYRYRLGTREDMIGLFQLPVTHDRIVTFACKGMLVFLSDCISVCVIVCMLVRLSDCMSSIFITSHISINSSVVL